MADSVLIALQTEFLLTEISDFLKQIIFLSSINSVLSEVFKRLISNYIM